MSRKPSLRQLRNAESPSRLSTSLVLPSADLWSGWFDGSAAPNPGRIGIGVLLISPGGERFNTSLKTSFHGCSNEAELHALIAALEFALEASCRRLILHGDSQVAIRYVDGEDQTRIPRLTSLIVTAQRLQAHFDLLQLRWVPRHRNAEADQLSRAALGLACESLSSHP